MPEDGAATPRSRRPVRTLAGALGFTLVWAVLCNFTLEFLQFGGSSDAVFGYTLRQDWRVFFLGSSVVWAILLLTVCLLGRLWVSCALFGVVTIFLGFANYEKITIRREPLYPSDLNFAGDPGFLTHMVSAATIAALVAVALLIALILLLVGRVLRRWFPRIRHDESPKLWRGLLITRVAGLIVLSAALLYVGHFNMPGNRFRAAYEDAGAKWAFWYQTLNYEKNGFVGGVLYNLNVPAMKRPAGYSAATMKAITAKYTALADKVNATRDPHALDDVNVVAVLSEAFSDPMRVRGVSLAQDPIPLTRKLLTHTDSGYMLAQLYGGGTANMEFETLTGMSLSQFEPQMNTPYQMLIPRYRQFPSAVGYFKDHGHEPIGIHPYMTSMYKRDEVYPILGFDKFIHDTTMQSTQKLEKSDFISDQSAFNEVEYQIRTTARPLFINLVTMQNHYPMAHEYAHPIHVTGLKGAAEAEASGYARGIAYTDQALKRFLAELQQSDEKTIVVFYGDHLPAVWPNRIYKENGNRRMKETPFFIWSNFATNQHQPLPTTSPIYFMPKVFDTANAALPPYYVLLEQLEKQIPAMEQGMYINPQNQLIKQSELTPEAKQVLHDYRLVQYDLSVGHRYSERQMFYPPTTTQTSQAASN